LLTFAVAGGGFAGVETVAGINDFVRAALRSYPRLTEDMLRVILIHSGPTIVPELDEKLGVYAQRKLAGRKVEVRLNAKLEGFSDRTVRLSDGTTIHTSTLVWTAGTSPSPLVETIPSTKERGRLLVTETLELQDWPRVWALGDCAAIPDRRTERFCPPTAQHALREAKVVAHNVIATVRGKEKRRFDFSTIAQLAAIGRRTGVANTPDGIDVCLLHGRIVAGISPQMGGLGSKWRVYVNVADIKETAKAVVTAGGKVIQETTTLGNLGSFAVFADPFGTEFAVRQGENKVTSATNGLGTFAWTELITDDLLAVSKFYGDLFGWTLGAPLPGDQLGRREWLANGRPIAGLLPRPPAMPKEIPRYWDVFFEVADPAATVEKAVRLGGRNLMPPIDIPHGSLSLAIQPALYLASSSRKQERDTNSLVVTRLEKENSYVIR
jgi:predicted enzyme related to lactoylglutathione lyase